MEIISEKRDTILFIRFATEFSIRNIKDVELLWDAARHDGMSVVVFDCKNLEFIDSSAIGTLVKYLNEAGNCGMRIVILNTSEPVRKIFHTAKLSRLFMILDEKQFEERFIANHERYAKKN